MCGSAPMLIPIIENNLSNPDLSSVMVISAKSAPAKEYIKEDIPPKNRDDSMHLDTVITKADENPR